MTYVAFNRIDGPLFTVGKAECYLAVEQYPEAPEWTGVFFCTTSNSIGEFPL